MPHELDQLRQALAEGWWPRGAVLALYVIRTDPLLGGELNSFGLGNAAGHVSAGFRPGPTVTPLALQALTDRLSALGVVIDVTVSDIRGF